MWDIDTLKKSLLCYLLVVISLVGMILYYKYSKSKNTLAPLKIISVVLVIGEIAKQIGLASGVYNPILLPFTVCFAFLISLLVMCWTKPGTFANRMGYSMTYTLSLCISVLMLVTPGWVYNIKNAGIEWNDMWGVFFHFACTFVCIWMLIYRPYKLEWKDLWQSAIIAFVCLCTMGVASWVLDTSFDRIKAISQPWFTIVAIIGATGVYSFGFVLVKVSQRWHI